jgi:hypothetical protein
VARVTGGEGPYLGEDSVFTTALPDAEASTFAVYANIDKLDSQTRDSLTRAWTDTPLQPLQAIGVGATQKDGHTEIRIRVVVR